METHPLQSYPGWTDPQKWVCFLNFEEGRCYINDPARAITHGLGTIECLTFPSRLQFLVCSLTELPPLFFTTSPVLCSRSQEPEHSSRCPQEGPGPCFDIQIKAGISHLKLIVVIVMPGAALNVKQSSPQKQQCLESNMILGCLLLMLFA